MPEFRVRSIQVQWNSPGCTAHRQPFLCPPSCAFRRVLDLHRTNAYSPASSHELLPYGTLAEITHEIRSKNVSPVEIVDSHLKRLEALHPKLNTFVHLNGEGARRQSRVAESLVLRGAHLGALHGVPLTIKSCIDVAGWPCPAGSLLRKDYVANQDAPLVSRLKAAGAILLGNTNTPEFLMAYETDNRLTGKTSNPGTWHTPRAARAEVKRQRLPQDARRAELAATAAARFACPPIFAESAD